MARLSYDECLARLKVHEGGYTNHPADPGGPTNFGITIADYRRYTKPGATAADVKAMTWDEAKLIYRKRYWDSQRCDELPAGVDDSIFDYGVNSGIGRSAKVLQRLVGVKIDGRIGDETLAAVAKRDPKALIAAINEERLRFLQSLKTWPVFGKGWGARVAEVKAFSLLLATRAAGTSAAPVPAPTASPEVQAAGKGMASPSAPAKAVVEHGGKVATAAGAVAGASWWSWISAHPVETGFIVVGAVVAVALLLHWFEARQRAAQDAPMPGTSVVPATS